MANFSVDQGSFQTNLSTSKTSNFKIEEELDSKDSGYTDISNTAHSPRARSQHKLHRHPTHTCKDREALDASKRQIKIFLKGAHFCHNVG